LCLFTPAGKGVKIIKENGNSELMGRWLEARKGLNKGKDPLQGGMYASAESIFNELTW